MRPEMTQGIAVVVHGVPPAASAAAGDVPTAATSRDDFVDRSPATVETPKAAPAEARGGTPPPRTARVIDLLRATATSAPGAEAAWFRTEALLNGDDLEDLESLVDSPGNLQFSRQYLEAVLDDLDEHRDEAEKKLRDFLREPYSSLLVPPRERPRR